MTDFNILRPRVDVPLSGAGNPTVTTTARLHEFYQNETTGELFTCVSIDDFGWGNTYKWAGSQGTIIDNDILSDSNANLVAMYTMDNISGSTLNDESPNANNGTITGATQVTGKIDNALDFGSDTDNFFVSTTHSASLNITGALSVSFLMKASSASFSSDRGIVNKYNSDGGANNRSWQITNPAAAGNQIRFRVSPDGTFASRKDVTGSVVVSDDTWNHVVCIFNPSTEMAIYVDGVLDVSDVTGIPASLQSNTEPVRLGRSDAGGDFEWHGDLDQLRIFDRVLTQPEVTALYNEGAIV